MVNADIYVYNETNRVLAHGFVGLRMMDGEGFVPGGRVILERIQNGVIHHASIKVPSLDIDWPLPLSQVIVGSEVRDRAYVDLQFADAPVIRLFNKGIL